MEKFVTLSHHVLLIAPNKYFIFEHITMHIFVGSAVHKILKEIITRSRLIAAIRKVSNFHQTSALEAKHSLDNQFAGKKVYYPYHSLMARYVDKIWAS